MSKRVTISRRWRLFKAEHLLFAVSMLLCCLLSWVSTVSGEISGPTAADTESAGPVEKNHEEANGATVIFEEPEAGDKPSAISLPEPDDCLEPSDREVLPRIAIIIDDMGHHHKMGGELLDLDLNLTFSFLPHAPFTREHEERAWQLGRDILVHMPMEPRDTSFDPGPGTLYLKDPADRIAQNVEKNIELVPHAIGVNNHMGSRYTANRKAMHGFMKELQKKDLFFVDSVTTSSSKGADEAGKLGIKTARRVVFLDNSQTQEDICRQLKRLVAYAKKHGSGIGIGHPNRATINALKNCRELLLQQVRIVGVHELVE